MISRIICLFEVVQCCYQGGAGGGCAAAEQAKLTNLLCHIVHHHAKKGLNTLTTLILNATSLINTTNILRQPNMQ